MVFQQCWAECMPTGLLCIMKERRVGWVRSLVVARINRDMQEIPSLHDVYTLIQDIETKGLLATGMIIEDI